MTQALAIYAPQRIPRRPRRRARVLALYLRAILHEFRWSLVALGALILIGALLYRFTPHEQFHNVRPNLITAIYGAWMAMLAQPILEAPVPWHLTLVAALYPIFGFVLIGEGVVRLALLTMSRRHGEKEWMNVMAATYRDHVILCGLGHLGYRVFEQLLAGGVDVVVVELREDNRFLAQAKSTGVPILLRDMKDDQALVDAGIAHARAIILCTNDDMANLEAALDARRLNPNVRVVMRLFDQRIAQKIAGALTIDVAFSASALAAPVVAAMTLQTKVLSSTMIAGIPHVIAELQVEPASPLAGKRIDEIEVGYSARVLARTTAAGTMQSPPSAATTVEPGDTLVIYTASSQLSTIATGAVGATS